MKKLKLAYLVLTTIPGVIVGHAFVFLAIALRQAVRFQYEEEFVPTAEWKPGSFVYKHFEYSLTVSRGIIYRPDPALSIQKHERVHVRQSEDLMFLAFHLAAVVVVFTHNWELGAAIWCTSVGWLLNGYIGAWLRSQDPYRDAEHERSAYAQTDERITPTVYGPTRTPSWADHEAEVRRQRA